MFSKIHSKWNSSIALRISFLYATLSTLLFVVIFSMLNWLMNRHLHQIKDQWILEEAREVEEFLRDNPKSSHKELQQCMREEAKFAGAQYVWFCLRDKNGKAVVFSDPTYFQTILQRKKHFPWAKGKTAFFETVYSQDGDIRCFYLSLPTGEVIQHAASLKDQLHFIQQIKVLFAFVCPMVFGLCWGLGFFMAKCTLIPVQVMTKAAHQFSRKNLKMRIPVPDSQDELANLAITLNNMLSKIELLLNEMQEMNENLAHDLRTLLSRIRVNAEVSLIKKRTVSEYQKVLEESLEECDHLLSVLNTLLNISEVTSGILVTQESKVKIERLIANCAEFFTDIADNKNIRLRHKNHYCGYVLGDYRKLQQALVNIVDNAIKYTPQGGQITISAFIEKKNVVIQIEDTGSGIADEHLPHIFKRFYRADRARSLTGSGLGLALTKAVIEAHWGMIQVHSKVDQGSCFVVTLPINGGSI